MGFDEFQKTGARLMESVNRVNVRTETAPNIKLTVHTHETVCDVIIQRKLTSRQSRRRHTDQHTSLFLIVSRALD